jgi:muramoyltetrapeptide carboxypeptidase
VTDANPTTRVAVVAASSVVPRFDLEAGVERLRAEGLEVRVDPRCFASHFTYAGADADRAASFWEAATDPAVDVVWMARGGYGAGRILPLLEELASKHGTPRRKLLVGYSDVTVLHEFVRTRWGWATLHAPMPAASDFGQYDKAHWRALVDLAHGRHPHRAWGERPLTWISPPAGTSVEGEVVGGNLALWASIVGTPYAPSRGEGRIVFFEDIGERFYRLDRMVTQIRQGGLLDGVAAVLLGDFTDCDDDPVKSVRTAGGTEIPLRAKIGWDAAVREIFGGLGVPVAMGLPVGHGPYFAPLPLGARFRAWGDGALELVSWDWLK